MKMTLKTLKWNYNMIISQPACVIKTPVTVSLEDSLMDPYQSKSIPACCSQLLISPAYHRFSV